MGFPGDNSSDRIVSEDPPTYMNAFLIGLENPFSLFENKSSQLVQICMWKGKGGLKKRQCLFRLITPIKSMVYFGVDLLHTVV